MMYKRRRLDQDRLSGSKMGKGARDGEMRMNRYVRRRQNIKLLNEKQKVGRNKYVVPTSGSNVVGRKAGVSNMAII
eukprot:7068582-Karenia_brevis.AAC.1